MRTGPGDPPPRHHGTPSPTPRPFACLYSLFCRRARTTKTVKTATAATSAASGTATATPILLIRESQNSSRYQKAAEFEHLVGTSRG